MLTFKDVTKQREAINEQLHRLNAPFRLAFMTQLHDSDRSKRITIEIGTPEQIEKGHAQNNLLYYAKVSEASKFLTGFAACLAMQSIFAAPVNQEPDQISEKRRHFLDQLAEILKDTDGMISIRTNDINSFITDFHRVNKFMNVEAIQVTGNKYNLRVISGG